MSAPGNSVIHQAVARYSRPVAMIAPHSGCGIGTPSPTNDSPLPASSAPPNRVADRMITGAITFGRMCRSMMRDARAPIARAASTYSRCRAESTEPRMRRP